MDDVRDAAPKGPQSPLVIGVEKNREFLLSRLADKRPLWVDLSRDTTIDSGHISSIVVDLPLADPVWAKPLSSLIARLPRDCPKMFVIDRKNRLEVVRANTLGSTFTVNRPLNDHDIHYFFGAWTMLELMGKDPAEKSVELASNTLARIFSDAILGRALDLAAVENAADEIATTLDDTGLQGWLRTVRNHHQGTMQHCLIVAGVMTRFGQRLGMSSSDVRMLTRIGLLHDVGKSKVPNAILDKPGKLTAEEFAVVRTHPHEGFVFLENHKTIAPIELEAVLDHHEYLDGSGYPRGLTNSSISDPARITTVCDVYSALVERRSYKREMSPEDAVSVLMTLAGDGKIEKPLVTALKASLD